MVEIFIDPQILALRAMHHDQLAAGYGQCNIRETLENQVQVLYKNHMQGNNVVSFHIGCWCPDFIGMDSDQIMGSEFSLDQAQQTIAREYGFSNWNEVRSLENLKYDQDFETSVDLVVEGRVDELRSMVARKPELVSQRSQYGHRATLLHYIAANGVESHRQITPLNASQITTCLINAGTDVNAMADIYGGSTVLELVETSAHPLNAGVTQEVIDVLQSAGAE